MNPLIDQLCCFKSGRSFVCLGVQLIKRLAVYDFQIFLLQVSASKGDITLVFDHDEERAEVEDQLLELRLFVPPPKTGEDMDPADSWKEVPSFNTIIQRLGLVVCLVWVAGVRSMVFSYLLIG